MGDTAPSPQDRAEDALEVVGDAASAIQSCSSFWESALGRLHPDEQQEIEANGLKLTDLIKVRKEAEKKQEDWKGKHMTFKFCGKKYTTDEIWGKIVHGIKVFDNFFSKVAALDASGKVALPWAAIRLVLGVESIEPQPAALEYKQDQLETIGGAMKTVVEVISYYVEFEALYKNDKWQVVQQLKSAIVDVYADILRVLCLAKAFYTKKEAKFHRVVQKFSLLLYDPGIFKDKLQSIENGNQKVENWARLVRWETEQRASDRVFEIQNHLQSLALWANIRSLSSTSSLNDHVEQSSCRLRDTGLWLMDNQKFQEWRYLETSALMLLSGSVGTGKTILTSLVVDGFLANLQPVAKSPVLYFYSKSGQDPEDVLRNFVQQLIIAQFNAHEPFDDKLWGGPRLSASDCCSRIKAFIESQDSVAIIIDSVEKCCPIASDASRKGYRESSGSYTFLNMFKDLTDIMKASTRPVKVFISYQSPNDGIDAAFRAVEWQHKYHVSANDQPATDLEHVVRSELEHWAAGEFLPNLDDPEGGAQTKNKAEETRARIKISLSKAIAKRASGMFTWAILVLRWRFRNNRELETEEDVKKELKKPQIPPTLEGLYDATYDVLYGLDSSPSTKLAGAAVRILFCAKKELSSTAFIDAVRATKSSTTAESYSKTLHNLISSSLGWIVYDAEHDVFRIQHPSVEHYLWRKNEKAGYEAHAHATTAEACLRTLCTAISRRNSLAENFVSDEEIPERGRSLERDSHSPSPFPSPPLSRPRSPSSAGEPSTAGNAPAPVQNLGIRTWRGFNMFGSSTDDAGSISKNDPSSPRPLAIASSGLPRPSTDSLPAYSPWEDWDGKRPESRPRSSGSSPGSKRRSDSVSTRSSARSESRNRPRSRAGSPQNNPFDVPIVTRRSSSVWSVSQGLTRSTRRDAEMNNPIQDFHEYATLYWASHYQSCREVCSEYRDLEGYVDNLLLNSSPSDEHGSFYLWIERVRKLFSQRPLGFYSEDLETELDHCISTPATPLQVSCVYGLTRVVEELCTHDNLWDNDNLSDNSDGSRKVQVDSPLVQNEQGMTGLHLACKFSHLEIVKYLATLKTAEVDFVVHDRGGKTPLQYSVEAARDTRLVEKLMDKKAVESVKPAALVEEVLKIKSAKKLRTESGVLVAAMNNSSCAESLVRLLLGRQPATYRKVDYKSKTPELAIAAISYRSTTLDLVQHVIDHRQRNEPKSMIDRSIITGAAASSTGREIKWHKRKKIWEWLVKEPFFEWDLDTIKLAAECALEAPDPELLRFLLGRIKKSFRGPYSWLLEPALSHTRWLGEVVDVVLECCKDLKVSSHFLEKAVENPVADVALISKLAERLEEDARFTMRMHKAIAMNRQHGAEILELLPRKLTAISNLLEPYWAFLAVANGNVAVLKTLLGPMKMQLHSPKLLQQIVSESPIDTFLNAIKGKNATIARPDTLSESESPEDHWDRLVAECVCLLADKVEGSEWIIQEVVEKAAFIRGPRVMKFLFDRAHIGGKPQFHVSKAMMLAAAYNTIYGHRLLPFLEQRALHLNSTLPSDADFLDNVLVDEAVLQITVGYGDIRSVTFLLSNYPLEKYSKEFRIAAARNPDPAVVDYVFRRVRAGSPIGMEELKTAAATSDAVFDCVLRYYADSPKTDPPASPGKRMNLRVDSKVLGLNIASKCKRSKTLREAFERGVAWEPTNPLEAGNLLEAAARNEHGLDMASFLLDRYQMTDKRIRVSTTLLEAAAGNHAVAPEMLRLLLSHCDDSLVESLVTIEVLVKAAANGHEAPESLRMLLIERDFYTLSDDDRDKLWGAIKSNRKYDSFKDTVELYKPHTAPRKPVLSFDRKGQSL